MFTTDGLTRSTALVTAREYASRSGASVSGTVDDAAVPGESSEKVFPISSRYMVDRCCSILSGFTRHARCVRRRLRHSETGVAGLFLESLRGRLHVTGRGRCRYELIPSHRAKRSERIASGCGSRVCDQSKFGFRTCVRRLSRKKHGGNRSPWRIALTRGTIKISSMRSLIGVPRQIRLDEAWRNLDGCGW
jgi:hypothetical protein